MTDVRELMIDAVAEAATATTKDRQRAAVKRLLAYAWGLLPEEERSAFLTRVDLLAPHELIGWSPKFPDKDCPSRSRVSAKVEEAARNWGQIKMGFRQSEIEVGNAVSKSIRIRRTPTPTQQRFMTLKLEEWKRGLVHSQSDSDGGKV